MPDYTFRYWFEWGSDENFCACLWSADDATKEKYGYQVDLHSLPISQDLIYFLCETAMRHDDALDWDYPPNPLLWTEEEEAKYYRRVKIGFTRLQQELGENYKIIYCESEE